MEKKTAATLLKGLIDSGKKMDPSNDEQRNRWRLDCRAVLERVFGKESRQLKEFLCVDWTGGISTADWNGKCQLTSASVQNGRRASLTILESAMNEVEQFWEFDQANSTAIDPFRLIERLCESFHAVARQLRHRHDKRPTLDVNDEYDVQNLIHALLLLDFDDVRPEEWTPSYAGASSRMDFLLKRERIVLEVKRTRRGLTAKEVGEQRQRLAPPPRCRRVR